MKLGMSRKGTIGLLAALTLVLTACGTAEPAATTAGPDQPAPATTAGPVTATTAAPDSSDEPMEEVTLRMTWWGNPERDARTGAMIDAFNDAHPGITVIAEASVFDGYFDKLTVGFAAGDAPDVVTLGGSYPVEYGTAGALVDLTEYADISGLSQFSPATYSVATYEGAVYGIPTGGNARGMLLNTGLFAAAGIDLPDASTWTWEEYVALAGELSAASGGEFVGTDWRIDEVKEEYAAQRGSEMYLAGGGIGISLETLTELFSIAPSLRDNGGAVDAELYTELVGTTMEQTLFGQGKAAMMPGYSNNVQNFADIVGGEVIMVKIPGESQYASPGLTVLPSQFFGIAANSEHPEEAAMLLNWMLSEPGPGIVILSNRGLSFNPTVLAAITPLLAQYEAQSAAYLGLVAAEGRDALPQPTEGKGEMDDVTERLQSEVMFGTMTPAEAAQAWLDEAANVIP